MDDITFSWVDGEITFDGAVKMQGYLVLHFELINKWYYQTWNDQSHAQNKSQ